jgi:hypothetical protein
MMVVAAVVARGGWLPASSPQRVILLFPGLHFLQDTGHAHNSAIAVQADKQVFSLDVLYIQKNPKYR